MEGLRKSEKFMPEYKLSIFLTLAMLAMLFFTAGMKTDAAEVPNGLVVNKITSICGLGARFGYKSV